MAMALKGDNVVVVPEMKLERMLCMKGGKGEGSYVKNSQAQARHAQCMHHLLRETLDGVPIPGSSNGMFVMADLGCSCGGNTLTFAEIIVRHMTKRYTAAGRKPPEFQVFFCDLPSNDFNLLFQLLLPMPEAIDISTTLDGRCPYYAAGVPGSFYGRLFPARSIDVFHSTFSLHWLSQVPKEVTDKQSMAYNKGRVFIHGAPDHTAKAYQQQFQADLASFLRSRHHEIRHGGAMFLVCLGRTSTDPTDQGGAGLLFGTHFQGAWDDLVQEGSLDVEKRDSFNLPVYAPSLEEFREVVESEGSFTINKLELVRGGSPLVVNRPDNAAEVACALANSCRSVVGVLVDAHIGDSLGEDLFAQLERRIASHARVLVEKLQFFHIVASLSFA